MTVERSPAEDAPVARTLKALKKNEFLAHFFPAADQARQFVLDSIQEGMRVGLAGSATLREMNFVEGLRQKGAVPLDHWDPSLTLEETLRIRKDQLLCDVLLSSVNALTERGELVSRDGVGNRISAMTFGPVKVFLLAGIQKIVPDLHAAFRRIREVAAPMRARSLNLALPCTKGEGCVDCHDPKRICRATLVLHRRPVLTDITVILIGERLGY
jgi:L-lactate utilization protein LutB